MPDQNTDQTPDPKQDPTVGDKTPEKGREPKTFTQDELEKELGRRIARERRNSERRIASIEAKVMTAINTRQQPQPAAAEPKLEQFDYDPEKYAQAKAEYTKKLAEKEWEAKQRTAETTKQREKLVSSWEEKVEKAADKYDDFTTIVGELQPTSPLITAIMESDADVAYYLGKHPKEAERIAVLGQISQIREIGKLEAKLAAEPEKPKAPSKAPAPIKPLSGAGSTATDVPSETDDTAAWIKKRQKQVHGKR